MNKPSSLFVNVHHLPDYWQKALLKAPLRQLIALDGTIRLKDILFATRDMPYHRPQQGNNAQACLAEWCSTCSAKHSGNPRKHAKLNNPLALSS